MTLNVLLKQQESVSLKCCTMILDQLAPLISEEDLHLSHLAIVLITTILAANIECAKTLKRGAFKSVLRLLESKVLQGLALEVRIPLCSTLLRHSSVLTHASRCLAS